MPTLLGLCGISIPSSVGGLDFFDYLQGGSNPSDGAAVIACPHPFGGWSLERGGREFRGVRTHRYTYVRTLAGPWLLYDNEIDPFQLANLVGRREHEALQMTMDARLQSKLKAMNDQFLPGMHYIRKWDYVVDETGTVPYTV